MATTNVNVSGCCGSGTEDKAALRQRRDQGLRVLRKLCFMEIGFSVLSIIVGIVALVFATDNPQFPFIAPVSLVVGILVLIGAVFGLAAVSKGMNKDEVETKVKAYITVHYSFNITCISLCSMSFSWGATGIAHCNSSDHESFSKCLPNKDGNMVASALVIVIGFILLLLCISGLCFFCFYGRYFGFKRRHERRMVSQKQITESERQMQMTNQAQAQPHPGNMQVQGQGQYTAEGVEVKELNEQGGYYNWGQTYK